MPEQQVPAFKGFTDPMDLVDRTDLAYEVRLALLQDWLADLPIGDRQDERRDALHRAIDALEMGAATQHDGSDQAPDHFGYGKPDRR